MPRYFIYRFLSGVRPSLIRDTRQIILDYIGRFGSNKRQHRTEARQSTMLSIEMFTSICYEDILPNIMQASQIPMYEFVAMIFLRCLRLRLTRIVAGRQFHSLQREPSSMKCSAFSLKPRAIIDGLLLPKATARNFNIAFHLTILLALIYSRRFHYY